MVKSIGLNGKNYYQCEVCTSLYDENNEKWVNRCEKWCERYGETSLVITRHSFKKGVEKVVKKEMLTYSI